MSKKNRFKKTAAALLALATLVAATGCDAFITTDSQANMRQIVASVNISSRLEEEDNASAQALKEIIDGKGLNTEIPKRDLVALFMTSGYQYVQSYGYSYEDTFEMLLDGLVERKVLVQYAIAEFLKDSATYTKAGCEAYVTAEINKATGAEKSLLEKHRDVLTLKYFLTGGGKTSTEDMKNYDEAVYKLHKSVNDSLDNTEKKYIKETTDSSSTGDVRTKPTNAGAEKEDYYVAPKDGLGYQIYTGRNDLGACESRGYKKVDGSTPNTRIKAYNSFLKNLQANGLIVKDEDTTDFTKMDYYYVELASQLETAVIGQYTDLLEKEAEADLVADGATNYVGDRYKETLAKETKTYDEDVNAFDTALSSLSDTTLPLYAPSTATAKFGMVYNILIPFSGLQNDLYTDATNRDMTDQELASYRAGLLQQVKAQDLRTTWFSDDEDENDAYKVTEGFYNSAVSPVTGDRYLFFKDNFYDENDRYEELGQYLGKYPFNGSVATSDGKYELTANKMNIDAFIDEVEGYLSYAVGVDGAAQGTPWAGYVDAASGEDYLYDEKNEKFADYSQFMYYTGTVAGVKDSFSTANYFVEGSTAYKALSAFNELMFAYSTDTGCLNTYMGYAVSPYKTSFVPEFEYAAQYAVNELGVGGYVVCPSTYGWHVIYVSFVYEGGEVYGGFKANEIDTDGTFSQIYFDSIKSTYVEDYAKKKQNVALDSMQTDATVSRYKDRYKDLTELDKK